MRVLVVGATGRVGRRVVAALREAGHEATTGDVAAFVVRALAEGLTGRYGIAD